MIWWFFESLEQGVECSRREHMDFIDNIDLVFSLVWFESRLLDEVSHILDSIVRCSIDLDTIEHISFIKSYTVSTFMAWITILQIETIDSLCEDTSGGSLAGSTRTREYIGMTHSILDERSTEYIRDGILSDDGVPVTGAIFGIERHFSIWIMIR